MCAAVTSWAGSDQSIPALFTQWRSVPSSAAASAARSWSAHSPTSPTTGLNRSPDRLRGGGERGLVSVEPDHLDRIADQPLGDRTPDAHRRPGDHGDGGPGGPGPLCLHRCHSGGISANARSMSTPWLFLNAFTAK